MTLSTRTALMLDYPRHFAWLLGAVLSIFGMSYAGVSSVPFAFYGALHASTWVLALRRPASLWQAVVFVAIAAALCQLTFQVGLSLRPLFMTLFGALGLYALVGTSAFIGAMLYVILVRIFWNRALQWVAMLSVASLCLAGSLFAVLTARHAPLLGGWWLVTLWWLAFSGGLARVDGSTSSTVRK